MSKDRFKSERTIEAFMKSTKWRGADGDAQVIDRYQEYVIRSRFRFREITKAIPCSRDSLKILDIGTTPYTLFLKEIYPHYDILTLDLHRLMEDLCKAMGIPLTICNLDEGYIPFEDVCFDVVIFSEVLEHLFIPPTEILKEIRRVLRERGKLILSVPNLAALYQRIRLLFGVSPLPNADLQMSRFSHGHIHEYTMKEIASLLRTSGFTIVCAKYVRAYGAKGTGISRLMREVYDPLVFLIPPFRSTIHIECYR